MKKLSEVRKLTENTAFYRTSNNLGRGYHGEASYKHGSEKAVGEFEKMHLHVSKILKGARINHNHKMVRDYLDSTHGRHLHSVAANVNHDLSSEHLADYIKRDVPKFNRRYNPALFEDVLIEKRKYLGSGRGTTVTGKTSHPIVIDPVKLLGKNRKKI